MQLYQVVNWYNRLRYIFSLSQNRRLLPSARSLRNPHTSDRTQSVVESRYPLPVDPNSLKQTDVAPPFLNLCKSLTKRDAYLLSSHVFPRAFKAQFECSNGSNSNNLLKNFGILSKMYQSDNHIRQKNIFNESSNWHLASGNGANLKSVLFS